MSAKHVKTTATTDAQLRQDLFNLKLEVINFHQGDNMQYVRTTAARDACFTSNNSMNWKANQMNDLQTEIAGLIPEEGSEIVDVKLERKIALYESMEDELQELTLRHEADLAVYEQVVGEKWRPGPGSSRSKSSKSTLAKAMKIAGK